MSAAAIGRRRLVGGTVRAAEPCDGFDGLPRGMIDDNAAVAGELLVVPSVDCRVVEGGVLLDKRFITGMTKYRQLWPGTLRCIIRHSPAFDPGVDPAFTDLRDPSTLPFGVSIIEGDAAIPDAMLRGAAIVLGSGDDDRQTGLAHQCRRLGIPCYYGVEYTLATRLQIIAADRRDLWSRLKTTLWTLNYERRRRRSFAAAAGLQANGFPAFRAYAGRPGQDHLYLDTRLSIDAMAGPEDLERLVARLDRQQPLRLLFTGRLERMKGAHHLLPLMQQLRARGVEAKLDIYGAGSLAPEIRAAIVDGGFEDSVRMMPTMDFDTEFVPRIKGAYDLFVCCHPQSDPSCTYIETLGCGIPIASFGNKAIIGLLSLAEFGWIVPIGDIAEMAVTIAGLSANRDAIATKAAAGLALARQYAFENVYAGRIAHLRNQLLQWRRSIGT